MPKKQVISDGPVRESSMYIKASDIEKFHKNNKNQKLNVSGQDERELDAQLKKRLEQDGDEESKKPEVPKF
jgi:hypothetical protein